MRGLLGAIVAGFGLTVGSHLASEGIAAVQERLQREARQRRRRRLLLAGVVACVLGLAALALPVPHAGAWVLGALLAAGALAGSAVLLRPSVDAWRARRALRAQAQAREARVASTLAAFEREVAAEAPGHRDVPR